MPNFNIALAEQYGYDKWPEMIAGKPARFIWQFLLHPETFSGWRLKNALPVQTEEGRIIQTQLWQEDQTDDGPQLRIDVISCTSKQKAMETLLELLGDFQGPILTDSRKFGLSIGDAAYTGRAEAPASLVFLLANMVVRILNAGPKIGSVLPLAQHLNNLWMDENVKFGNQKVQPEFRRFTVAEEKNAPSKPVKLLLDAEDPLNRPLWYRLSAAEGEFSSEGGQLFFYAARGGKVEIQAEAINPNGGSARTTLEINTD